MRISKNKIIFIITVVFIIGLLAVSKQNDDMPEDMNLSSGTSVVWGSMEKFNNYENAMHYAYKRKWNKRELTLNEKSYYFLDRIDYMDEVEEYPQGLCFAEGYVLISSYSGVRGELGKVKLYDRYTGEYLLAIGMDEHSHLGGIAYDGKYLWVCNSSHMAIEKISFQFIKKMIAEYKGKLIDVRNLVDCYRVKNIPSTITCYKEQLWVATHSVWNDSIMMSYQYNHERETLEVTGSFSVPEKVQGVSFTDDGEVYLSTSYGRKNSSYIRKYVSVDIMSKNVDSYTERIELPPCSEGIVYESKNIYVLFESAGKKYLEGTDGKGKSSSPLNRILVIEDKKDPLYR